MSGDRSRYEAGGKRRGMAMSVRQTDHGWLARFRTDEEPAAPALGRQELRDSARAALRSLDPTEAEVLRLRFGVDGADRSLEAVGRRLGVDAESAARVEADALRKLRRAGRRDRETYGE